MAITARVGTCTCNPKTIFKDQEGKITWDSNNLNINVSAWKEINDLTCEFILDGAGYHGKNYMQVHWSDIDKYYFIEKREGLTGNMTKITATCDVLYTYRGAISGSAAVINRTSWSTDEITDFMLRDNKVTTTSKTIISSENLHNVDAISNTEWYYVGIVQKEASVGTAG